jgi:hypothetical protein
MMSVAVIGLEELTATTALASVGRGTHRASQQTRKKSPRDSAKGPPADQEKSKKEEKFCGEAPKKIHPEEYPLSNRRT